MDKEIFTNADLSQISAHGMTPEKVISQISIFKKGIPFTKILRPCTVNDGITALDNKEIERYISIFDDAQKQGRCMKFVPASGAASRMFKYLLEVYNEITNINDPAIISSDNRYKPLISFTGDLERYAFFDALKKIMKENGNDIDTAVKNQKINQILDCLLSDEGLNLSNIPKGLIPFHRYDTHSRTPFEEQLVEALNYTADKAGRIKIHFTISPEHETRVRGYIDSVLKLYEREGASYEIAYSCQRPYTDTIAVDMDNEPFRDEKGSLVFRPGGHGALIENLSDLEGDIVFIKNIDNVSHDRFKDITFKYKKAIGGFLIELQDKIFGHVKTLIDDNPDEQYIKSLFIFMEEHLSVIPDAGLLASPAGIQKEYLIKMLNRPLRVCGMVKNEGEPGGGPFWVEKAGKGSSIQIVESSQIDMDKPDQKQAFKSATHFNPVDLVCGLRDYWGNPYNLRDYVDNDADFISLKSQNGKELKALELPGLWNGSMAFWNTVFIEVPAATFSPVKTVFDLVRDEHQPG
ncbi:MAG: DUF4301 family protein [Deltaproteobacteria bacterium]|nr:DUF4301 family protein [Deltaproteobacteria bacterium]